MLKRFHEFVREQELFDLKSRLLVAISGGRDSVCLAHLCLTLDLNFELAHCNFGLRGEESDEDERFVRQLASEWGVPVHTASLEVVEYAGKAGVSTQMAARHLKFEFLKKLAKELTVEKVLLAHHQDDVAETFLLNLARRTGLRGLRSIPVSRNIYVRPLLFASRQEIDNYIRDHRLHYREDSSNAGLEYERNVIRHEILPTLGKINPQIVRNINQTVQNLREVEPLYHFAIRQLKRDICHTEEADLVIGTANLMKSPSPSAVLFEILRPYGFNSSQVVDMLGHIEKGNSGQRFQSDAYEGLLHTARLTVRSRDADYSLHMEIPEPGKYLVGRRWFEIEASDCPETFTSLASEEYIDTSKIEFPVVVRSWKAGDRFQPLGMQGSQKIQDFLSDRKIAIADKAKIRLLVDRNNIVWVMGYRISDPYKVNSGTQSCYRLSWR